MLEDLNFGDCEQRFTFSRTRDGTLHIDYESDVYTYRVSLIGRDVVALRDWLNKIIEAKAG